MVGDEDECRRVAMRGDDRHCNVVSETFVSELGIGAVRILWQIQQWLAHGIERFHNLLQRAANKTFRFTNRSLSQNQLPGIALTCPDRGHADNLRVQCRQNDANLANIGTGLVEAMSEFTDETLVIIQLTAFGE